MGGRLHKRKERKLGRAQYVSCEVASLRGRPGQCPAAYAASCTRFARVESLVPCNRIPIKDRPLG